MTGDSGSPRGVPLVRDLLRNDEPPPAIDARPRIVVNDRQLRDIVADAWRACREANSPPTLFRRGGRLVKLVDGADSAAVVPLTEAAMLHRLSKAADWVKETGRGERAAQPPRDVPRIMLAEPGEEIPVLDDITASPVFDAGGRLVRGPGYDAESRLWIASGELAALEVPDIPSCDDVEQARSLLVDELLVDFPFADASDRAHAVAAFVMPFIRSLVGDCTPIHLVEAPSPGSGKTLIADLVAIVASGKNVQPTTLSRSDEEMRKRITSLLLCGARIILLDNVTGELASAQLAAAITATTWADRLLGRSEYVHVENRALWIVTANNPSLSSELARRCIRIRLDTHATRPWARRGFKHAAVREWAHARRAELVRAVLVLVRHWLACGRPSSEQVLGSFERWSAVVGGIVGVSGVPGFLADRDRFYAAADAESQDWDALASAWWFQHGGAWVTATQVASLASRHSVLLDVLGEGGVQSQRVRISHALRGMRDRPVGSWLLEVGRNADANAGRYRLAVRAEHARALRPEIPGADPRISGAQFQGENIGENDGF
ncbi:MAG: hypothetical protein K8M05_28925 [Deltaproteobacteria bacterium]|nr:hypothetical protein [Kofleriaceae bacterium]